METQDEPLSACFMFFILVSSGMMVMRPLLLLAAISTSSGPSSAHFCEIAGANRNEVLK